MDVAARRMNACSAKPGAAGIWALAPGGGCKHHEIIAVEEVLGSRQERLKFWDPKQGRVVRLWNKECV